MKYIIVIVLAIFALVINFKAEFISEKVLKKEASQEGVLKLKILALFICIVDFILALICF